MMESQNYSVEALKLAKDSQGVLSIAGQPAAQIAADEFERVFRRAKENFEKMNRGQAHPDFNKKL